MLPPFQHKAKHLSDWGDIHMYDEDTVAQDNPRIKQILDHLINGNDPWELAIMLVQHMDNQQFRDLEQEVDNSESDYESEGD